MVAIEMCTMVNHEAFRRALHTCKTGLFFINFLKLINLRVREVLQKERNVDYYSSQPGYAL